MLSCWDVYPRTGQKAALLEEGSFWSTALREDPFLGRPAGRSQAGSLGCCRTGSQLAREPNCHVRPLSQPWGTWAAGRAWRRGNPGLQLSCWHCLQALGATGPALQSALTTCMYKNVRSKKKVRACLDQQSPEKQLECQSCPRHTPVSARRQKKLLFMGSPMGPSALAGLVIAAAKSQQRDLGRSAKLPCRMGHAQPK